MFITRSLLSYVVMYLLEGMCSDLGHKTRAGTTGMVFRLIIMIMIKQMIILMINWNTIWSIRHTSLGYSSPLYNASKLSDIAGWLYAWMPQF